MEHQKITYKVVKGGLQIFCTACQTLEFTPSGYQGWDHFYIMPAGPHSRSYFVECKSCGNTYSWASLIPDW